MIVLSRGGSDLPFGVWRFVGRSCVRGVGDGYCGGGGDTIVVDAVDHLVCRLSCPSRMAGFWVRRRWSHIRCRRQGDAYSFSVERVDRFRNGAVGGLLGLLGWANRMKRVRLEDCSLWWYVW